MELHGAPVVGSIGKRPDGKDAPFWDGLLEGQLKIQRCEKCASWNWSPTWRCGQCGSWDLNWEEVERRGIVYSWIRTWKAFSPQLADIVPFVTVLVELPQANNRRLLGMLVGPEEGLRIGAPVEGVIQAPGPLTNNLAILRWRLAEGATSAERAA